MDSKEIQDAEIRGRGISMEREREEVEKEKEREEAGRTNRYPQSRSQRRLSE